MTSSKPRVLHIITRLDPGGSTANTLASVDRLRQYGFDTALAYGVTRDPDGSLESMLKRMGAPLFHVPHLVRNVSPVKDLLALKEARRLLKREHFDLAHTHTSKAGVVGRLAARAHGIPVVHTPHGHIFYGYFGPALTRIFIAIERRMARRTARIISLTDMETRDSLEQGIGRPEQYVTIHSGVPLSAFRRVPPDLGIEFRSKLGIPSDAFLFVSAGRLVPIKGFDVLLRGFAGADFGPKPVFLAIAGSGAEKESLESIVATLGVLDRVRLAGDLQDIRGLLSAGNAFALASRNEGMGRVLVEAMAAGLPVIGTAVGGIPSLVADNATGMLVPPEDAPAIARAMEKMAADPELRRRLGREASERVYPEYDEGTMVDRLARLYREVLMETPT